MRCITRPLVSLHVGLVLTACGSTIAPVQTIPPPSPPAVVSAFTEPTQSSFAPSDLATLEAYHRPLPSTLEIDGVQQTSGIGGYCWRGECADGPAIRTAFHPLVARSPEEAQFHLPINQAPEDLSLQVLRITPQDEIQSGEDWREWNIDKDAEQTLSLPLQSDQLIVLSLDPAPYLLLVFAAWDDIGDVLYGFFLEVE